MGNKKLFSILLLATLSIGITNPINVKAKTTSKVKLNKSSVTL